MILLDLPGGVALLLWGLHMVHSGIVRAFGSDLRRLLGTALRNRFLAFLAGVVVTTLLQSSTATGLMTASFVTGGAVDLAPALAIMLGANVGTTLIVQALSFNVTAGTVTVPGRGYRIQTRWPDPHARSRARRDWHRSDAVITPHSARHVGAGRTGAGGSHSLDRDHRRYPPLCPDGRCVDLGCSLECHGRVVDHVAGVLWLHHAGGSTRPHTWRQSRK